MAQIKLTPEELRQSAQRYAQGSQEIDQILNTLTHEQQVIDANWMDLHLIALKHNSTNCLQKSNNSLNCWKTSTLN